MPFEDQATWEEHAHEAVVHPHEHYHVTHNYNDRAGGFDHFSWKHVHDHDHAGVSHRHYPHQDFEREHHGEAHVHDHGEPVKKRTPAKEATTAPKTRTSKKQPAPA